MTSRFFLVDRVSGVPTSQFAASLSESRPKAVRYLSKMELRIEMLDTRENPEKAGRIFPPVAVIEYGEVSIDDLERGKEVEFEFSVKYKMEMREAKKDIGVRRFSHVLCILNDANPSQTFFLGQFSFCIFGHINIKHKLIAFTS